MRWYGIVSSPARKYVSHALTPAKASQAAESAALPRDESITNTAHCLDAVGGKLAAYPLDVDVDQIGPWIEVDSPYVGEQFLAGADLAATMQEVR
jgi:hypothetical protein